MGGFKMIVPKKVFKNNNEFESFMQRERLFMHTRIYEAINEAFENYKSMAEIVAIEIENDDSTFSINSPRKEWLNSLKLSLEWFTENELYEKSSQIFDLMKLLENDSKKKKLK